MWPFGKRSKVIGDPLTQEVDLSRLAPFREVGRYLLVWTDGLGQSYGLVVVYEGARGERVHVVHSPGHDYGGTMETHAEWLATAVTQHDPDAVAIFLVWPTGGGFSRTEPELIRVWFDPNPSGVASSRQTILLGDAPDGSLQVDNVFAKQGQCRYAGTVFGPRNSPQWWSEVLGCEIVTFTQQGWEDAADQVDPDRRQRAAVERVKKQAYDDQIAWMKEMGLYGEEAPQASAEPLAPSPAQQDRVLEVWAAEPDAATFQVGSYMFGGANLGGVVTPVVGLVLPTQARDELPLSVEDFTGIDQTPPHNRRVRLWDETLLTVEEVGSWRAVVFFEEDLLPSWFFDAAAAPPEENPGCVVALVFQDGKVEREDGPMDVLEIGDAVGMANLEDRRGL